MIFPSGSLASGSIAAQDRCVPIPDQWQLTQWANAQKLSLLEVHASVLGASSRQFDNSVIISEVRRRGGKG
jgi:hypothetical protein